MPFNLAAVRQLVFVALGDDDLKDLCFDHFPAVYEEFTAGQTKGARVLSLVSFAERHGRLNTLLDAIKQANPHQFALFEAAAQAGRGATTVQGNELEWGTPVLFSRSDDNQLIGPPNEAARPAGAQITITQQVDTNQDGNVTGVKVGTIQGPVSFRGPVTLNLTNLPPALAEPRPTAGSAADDLHLPVIKVKQFEPETVLIPGGPFRMGSDDPAVSQWERPSHDVVLPDFRIGKYPVTIRQYAEFIRQVKSQDKPDDPGWFLRQPPADRLDHPVGGVSWLDAVAYCDWLSEQCKPRRYVLPSEAEWEKATRGAGRQGGGGAGGQNRYPWGEEWIEGRCNAASGGTTAVTAHPDGASGYGVEDLLGNVQEWTSTLWGSRREQPDYPYPYRADDGREIQEASALPSVVFRVHRGGSYRDRGEALRCGARGISAPEGKVPWRGFRVAMKV